MINYVRFPSRADSEVGCSFSSNAWVLRSTQKNVKMNIFIFNNIHALQRLWMEWIRPESERVNQNFRRNTEKWCVIPDDGCMHPFLHNLQFQKNCRPTYVAGIQSNATKPIPVITMQEKTKEVVTDSSKIRERDIWIYDLWSVDCRNLNAKDFLPSQE